jgi:HTH-type transcriptional regulator/antitoxin HigA
MNELKYTIIKTEMQYDRYCHILEKLVVQDRKELADEIDLLTLLIEKWDSEHNDFIELNPIELIKALMKENHLRARDLVEILGLSKGTVSKILNCQKGLSKGSIRILAQHFKVHQEALNKSYELVSREKNTIQKAS